MNPALLTDMDTEGSRGYTCTPPPVGRKKKRRVGKSSPLPSGPGGRVGTSKSRSQKAIRFRRQRWLEDSDKKLTDVRLNTTKEHVQISAAQLAHSKDSKFNPKKGYRGRCIVCCSMCMGEGKKLSYHASPWGFHTVNACETCGEYLCCRKSSARWDGRTCWEVWHSDVDLPSFDCKNKIPKHTEHTEV